MVWFSHFPCGSMVSKLWAFHLAWSSYMGWMGYEEKTHRDIGNPWATMGHSHCPFMEAWPFHHGTRGHEAWKKYLKRLVVSKESWILMLHGDTSECSQIETTSQDRMTYQTWYVWLCFAEKRTTSQGFKHRSPYWHCRELGCTHFCD